MQVDSNILLQLLPIKEQISTIVEDNILSIQTKY